MHAKPQQEHEWLHKLVGNWVFENEATMEPGQPPLKFGGRDTVRSLGGMWVVCEGEGEMPGGGTAHTVMTLGYDPARSRFVGTFIGSMMTHLWIYDGTLNAERTVLTLDTEGPSFSGDGTMAKYQDIIEFLDDDHRLLKARVQGDDGTWNEFMTANYRRKK
jgi:hypothetical protein